MREGKPRWHKDQAEDITFRDIPSQNAFADTLPAGIDESETGSRGFEDTQPADPSSDLVDTPPVEQTGVDAASTQHPPIPEEYAWLAKGKPRPSWSGGEPKETVPDAELDAELDKVWARRNAATGAAREALTRRIYELEAQRYGEYDSVPPDVLSEDDTDYFPEVPDGSKEWRDRWRGRLRRVVTQATKKLKRSRPPSRESGKHPDPYLEERSKEIDAEAAKMGKVEEYFRAMGERYNKLGWKSKLAVGVSLGIGSGVALSFASIPAAIACLSGVAAQRVAGLSGAFIKYEKQMQEGKWKKEKAMAKAMRDATVMTGGMLLLMEGARESTEWLKQHWPFGSSAVKVEHPAAPHVAPATSVPETVANTAPATEEARAAAGAVPAETTSETRSAAPGAAEHTRPPILEVTVNASPGHGYEWMMKRVWEQLQQQQGIDPTKFAEGSDIRRLLEADASSIDKVVHQIATDPSHGFFNADGTSVKIDMSAQLSINADGQLHLSDAAHPDMVRAAEDMSTTPVHAEASTTFVEQSPIVEKVEAFPNTAIPDAPESGTPLEKSPVDASDVRAELSIPTGEPHLYAGADAHQIFVYGGTQNEQMALIQTYLTENPHTAVLSADASGDHRVAWHLVEGKPVASQPIRVSGFLGLFKTFADPPGPEDFKKVVT
ncbi:MAG: hypothetical protein AAB442_03440 [Patescibacteria group bacterium]